MKGRLGHRNTNEQLSNKSTLTLIDPISTLAAQDARFAITELEMWAGREEEGYKIFKKGFLAIQKGSLDIASSIRSGSAYGLDLVNKIAEINHPDIRKLAIDMIADNLPKLQIQFKEETEDYKEPYYLAAVSKLILFGTEEQRRWGNAFFKTYKDKLPVDLSNNGNFVDKNHISILQGMMLSYDDEMRNAAEKMTVDAIRDKSRSTFGRAELMGDIIKIFEYEPERAANIMGIVYDEYEQIIEKYGFNAGDVWVKWQLANPDLPKALNKNLGNMMQIEEQREGATKVLYEQFGILNFGRYPYHCLLNQFDQRGDQSLPYGVLLYPENDHNGALFDNVFLWLLDADLKDEYFLRIIEGGSKVDIARRLIQLKKTYGNNHKISFAIIGGHGTKDSIQFGGEDPIHKLTTKDLLGRGAKKASEFFQPNPNIVLVSCETGTEGGISDQLADMLGASVIAPTVSTNIDSIRANIIGGKLSFTVDYSDEGVARTSVSSKSKDKISTPLTPERVEKIDRDLITIANLNSFAAERGGMFILSGGYATEALCGGVITRPHGDIDGHISINARANDVFSEVYKEVITNEPTMLEMEQKGPEKVEFREDYKQKPPFDLRRIELTVHDLDSKAIAVPAFLINSQGQRIEVNVVEVNELIAGKIHKLYSLKDGVDASVDRATDDRDTYDLKRLMSVPGVDQQKILQILTTRHIKLGDEVVLKEKAEQELNYSLGLLNSD